MTRSTFVTCPDCGRDVRALVLAGAVSPYPHDCTPKEKPMSDGAALLREAAQVLREKAVGSDWPDVEYDLAVADLLDGWADDIAQHGGSHRSDERALAVARAVLRRES